jgi:hypothetical protein
VVDTQDLNPGLFTLEDANEMITEIKRLHSEERLLQATATISTPGSLIFVWGVRRQMSSSSFEESWSGCVKRNLKMMTWRYLTSPPI